MCSTHKMCHTMCSTHNICDLLCVTGTRCVLLCVPHTKCVILCVTHTIYVPYYVKCVPHTICVPYYELHAQHVYFYVSHTQYMCHTMCSTHNMCITMSSTHIGFWSEGHLPGPRTCYPHDADNLVWPVFCDIINTSQIYIFTFFWLWQNVICSLMLRSQSYQIFNVNEQCKMLAINLGFVSLGYLS